MKRAVFCLFLVAILAMAASASTTYLSVEVGFNNLPLEGVVSPVSNGQTSIVFSSILQSPPGCAGMNADLCGAGGGFLSDFTFTSGTSFTFSLGGVGLSYTTSGPWEVVEQGAGYVIETFGMYTYACNACGGSFLPTDGYLNLTFQEPPVDGNYPFSASGTTTHSEIPEPATLLLFGSGLVYLGILRRKKGVRT